MADTPNFYFGCYWGGRPEGAEECASRVLRLTDKLSSIDPGFAVWQVVVSAQASRPLPGDATRLASLMEERNPERGNSPFVVSLVSWRQGEEVGASVRVSCGGSAGVPGVVNSVVLEPVYEGYGHAPWLRNARAIIGSAVEVFEPDWAALLAPEHRHEQSTTARVPIVGGLTYLDGWRGEPPAGLRTDRLCCGWLVDLLGNAGTLPAVSEVVRARKLLDDAGLMQPTPQTQPGGTELRC